MVRYSGNPYKTFFDKKLNEGRRGHTRFLDFRLRNHESPCPVVWTPSAGLRPADRQSTSLWRFYLSQALPNPCSRSLRTLRSWPQLEPTCSWSHWLSNLQNLHTRFHADYVVRAPWRPRPAATTGDSLVRMSSYRLRSSQHGSTIGLRNYPVPQHPFEAYRSRVSS
jgi:hypothetical protein